MSFHFTLPKARPAYFTSAGAYRPDGTLVRTLWRHVRYTAGTHGAVWDGEDENGRPVPAGAYEIRVLYHNVEYRWEGVIGNTSSAFTGPHIYNAIRPVQCLDNGAASVFYATGYNEQGLDMHRFALTDVQTPTHFGHGDPFTVFTFVATDGQRVYYADTGGGFDQTNSTFVTAVKVSDDTPYPFAEGKDARLNGVYESQHYPGVADLERTDYRRTRATGLAVQKQGRLLAVAHGPLNLVRLFDKASGRLLKSFAVADPQGLAFTARGDLWVLSGRTALRYTHVDGEPSVAATIRGLSQPLAVAAHPSDPDLVLIADGGDSQQVKAFRADAVPLWAYGQRGGYKVNGPAVTGDKFGFQWIDTGIGWIASAGLTVLPDGSFWVTDSETNRLLHISTDRKYREQIAAMPTSYVQGTDPNDPSRLLGGSWLEYRVDYAKPLVPGDPSAPGGNGCWKLVNNWLAGHEGEKEVTTPFNGLSSVVTLSNGHVYAVRPLPAAEEVVELTPAGMRDTGAALTQSGFYLYPDGSCRYQIVADGVVTFYRQALTGFDAKNDPQWRAPVALCSAPAGPDDPYTAYGGPNPHHLAFGGYRLDTTASGVLVSFNQGKDPGWHLGGVKVGTDRWLWEASPSVGTDDFQHDPAHPGAYGGLGNFDVGDDQQYCGSIAMALPTRRDIVYGFPGENWKHSEADQWMHFYDDGLFVGQFGRDVVSANIFDAAQHPGVAGNAYSATLFTVKGELYQTNNDEASHGGVHRWHFVGANLIAELSGSGQLGSSVALKRR